MTEYRISVRRISELSIGKLWLDEIKPRDVREVLQQVEARGATPSMQARLLVQVRMMFLWMVRDELVNGNPAETIESPRYHRGRRPAVTPAGFEALRVPVREDLANAVREIDRREAQLVSDLLEVLRHSGLRSIVAMRLVWEDIDLEGRSWMIRSPANKGGEQRLPLHPELVPILRRRQLETSTETGPFAGHWHVRNSWRRFKTRHKEWAGRSLHSLRHGFVTRIRAAAGDAAASHLARHKSKSMMEHYSHFDEETFRKVIDVL